MRKLFLLVTLLLCAALIGQAFAGAVSPVERTRTVDDPVVTNYNYTTDIVDYGSYSFTAIRGSYNTTGWGDGDCSWTSIWNTGKAMSADVKSLLQASGALNGTYSELKTALLSTSSSYYSNSIGIAQQDWMKTTDAYAAWVGGHNYFGCRVAGSSYSSSASNQLIVADRQTTSVTWSSVYGTGNYVTQEKDNAESTLTWDVTHNTYAQDRNETFQEKTAKVNVTNWQVAGTTFVSPLVLDLKGKGVLEASNGEYRPHSLTSLKNCRLFDLYGDDFPVLVEWVGANDGLLCVPKADGAIDGTCLFGNNDGYADGYSKLAIYDTNKDRTISGDELTPLRVWVDADMNAEPSKGEISTMAELGITSISLNHKFFRSSFVKNGKTHVMWDWFPSVVEVEKI